MAPSGYAKKMSVEISPSSAGAESNYAIKVTLVKGSGSNAAGIGYLDNQCLNWPNDIRFTDNSGNELSFYREESDAADGTWWIKVSSIPTGSNTTIWVYFGKSGDSDASSGANTFIHFDNFETGDLSRWDSVGTAWSASTTQKAEGSYSAKGVYHASSRSLTKNISPGRSVLYHLDVYPDDVKWAFYPVFPTTVGGKLVYALILKGGMFQYYTGSISNLPTATSYTLDAWQSADVAIDNANQLVRWWINGASKGTAALKDSAGNAIATDDYVANCNLAADANSGGIVYVDRVWVRPYVYPEPSVGTPGEMQDAGGQSVIPIMMAHRRRRIL